MVAIKVLIDDKLQHSLVSPRSSFLIGTPVTTTTTTTTSSSSSSPSPPSQQAILLNVPFLPVPANTSAQSWHREHVKTINNMLPGGLSVIGMYTPLPPSALKSISSLVFALHLDFVLCCGLQPNSLAAKAVSADNGGELKSASLKVIPHLTKRCIVLRAVLNMKDDFDFGINQVDEGQCIKIIKRNTSNVLIGVCKTLQSADDEQDESIILDEDDQRLIAALIGIKQQTVQKKHKKKKKSLNLTDSDPLTTMSLPIQHNVTIYFPISSNDPHISQDTSSSKSPSSSSSTEPCSSSSSSDTASEKKKTHYSVAGSISVFAVVTPDATAGNTLTAIRHDICRTLQVRYDFLSELESESEEKEVEGSQKNTKPQPLKSPCPLPRRVMAWPGGNPEDKELPFTDYMIDGETLDEDVASRFADVLSWTERKLDTVDLDIVESRAIMESAIEPTKDATKSPPKLEELPSDLVDLEDAGPPALLVNSVMFAIILTFMAIVIRQFI